MGVAECKEQLIVLLTELMIRNNAVQWCLSTHLSGIMQSQWLALFHLILVTLLDRYVFYPFTDKETEAGSLYD